MGNRPIIYHDYLLGLAPWYERVFERCAIDPVFLEGFLSSCLERGDRSTAFGTDMLLGYREYGQQTFVVGPRLQAMFSQTGLRGIRDEHIKCPYPEFYVAVPGNEFSIWGGEVTRWHPVTGVLVRRVPGGFFFFLWGAENERSRAAGDDCTYWFSLDFGQVLPSEDIETYLDRKLHDHVHDIDDTVYGFRGIEVSVKVPTDGRRDVLVGTAIHISRVVINMCLYLDSIGSEVGPDPVIEGARQRILDLEKRAEGKGSSKRKRIENRVAHHRSKLTSANVVWIAPSIENAPGIKYGISGGDRAYHWVRGHWRNQATGSGYIRKWIQPYERNKASPRRVGGHLYHIKPEDLS